MSSDSGAGNRIGPFKGRVTAIGATAGYDFIVAGTPVSTRVKVLREVDVENRAQGTIGLFSVGFPLGGIPLPRAPGPLPPRTECPLWAAAAGAVRSRRHRLPRQPRGVFS